jgi:hypothetical protein
VPEDQGANPVEVTYLGIALGEGLKIEAVPAYVALGRAANYTLVVGDVTTAMYAGRPKGVWVDLFHALASAGGPPAPGRPGQRRYSWTTSRNSRVCALEGLPGSDSFTGDGES